MVASKRGEISNWQLRRDVATLRGELSQITAALGVSTAAEAAAILQGLVSTVGTLQAAAAAASPPVTPAPGGGGT
jgi:hypothetical protein